MSTSSNVILYIHGLGSSKDSPTYQYIKNYFEPMGYIVISDTFNLNRRPLFLLKEFTNIIEQNNVSIVIGSSLGGFYALHLNCPIKKIIINPCLLPSEQLIKRNNNSTLIYKLLSDIEASYPDNKNIFGIFGDNDELFSYMDLYNTLYRDSFIKVLGKHRLEKESLYEALNEAVAKLKIDII